MRYKFKYKPYKHQIDALEKSWEQEYFAYFMDMGTGKSKVLIDNISMLYDKGYITAALIVAPKGVYKNWERKEIPTHLPDHIQHNLVAWSPEQTIKKKKQIDSLFQPKDDRLQIFLMNVEAFSTKKGMDVAQRFLFGHRALLAIDESTTIKSKSASRTKNIIKLGKKASYRRILTGSPITKSPLDLFTQCQFLDGYILRQDSFFTFQNRYAKMVRRTMGTHSFNQIVGYQNLGELNGLLEPVSFRVRKEDCLDLPSKVYIKRVVELTQEQKGLYEQIRRAALAVVQGEGIITAPTVLTQILRLQQVCSGFAKLEDDIIITVKTNKIKELTDILQEVDGKVIIWANFTNDLINIKSVLDPIYGDNATKLFYGATPSEERQTIVEEFQDPANPLRFFVGQPRTGGYGLTLTEAHTVIYYSNGYDLEVRLQSEDRAHRIGQENKVTYIDIVAENTVDEKIIKALRNKIDIASQILSEDVRKWIA